MNQSAFLLSLLITFGLAVSIDEPSNRAIALESGESHSASSNHGTHEKRDYTAPLFNNLGNHHHPTSTKNSLAQRYFDQGLILTYGF